jgi:hypothetical protein
VQPHEGSASSQCPPTPCRRSTMTTLTFAWSIRASVNASPAAPAPNDDVFGFEHRYYHGRHADCRVNSGRTPPPPAEGAIPTRRPKSWAKPSPASGATRFRARRYTCDAAHVHRERHHRREAPAEGRGGAAQSRDGTTLAGLRRFAHCHPGKRNDVFFRLFVEPDGVGGGVVAGLLVCLGLLEWLLLQRRLCE